MFYQNKLTDIKYLPHIDGIRAIAVILVVLYHLEFQLFSGGYIGVDVFFVISGYLITRIIQSDINQNRFQFRVFYLHRARRLFPALFFTLTVTLIYAVLFYSPDLLERLSKVILSVLYFTSNLFFHNEQGYFDLNATTKPLLHTWSLSVEEQFYLFWPLSLLIINKYGRKYFTEWLGLVLISSLLMSEYLLANESASFYIMPLRIFEFMFGVLLNYHSKNKRSPAILNALFALGLVLVLYASMSFTKNSRFPGINALIPVIGAYLLLQSGGSFLAAKILCNKLLINIGKISYSLYLIHWPIIVFYKYHFITTTLSLLDKITILCVSFVTSILMYIYIEQPFRKKSGTHYRINRFITYSLAFVISITILSWSIWKSSGWPWRLNSNVKSIYVNHIIEHDKRLQQIRAPLCHHNTFEQNWDDFSKNFDQCNKVLPNSILVIGDSHAADLWMGLQLNLKATNIIQLTAGSCRIVNHTKLCSDYYASVSKFIEYHSEQISQIYYTQRGKSLDSLENIREVQSKLEAFVSNKTPVTWVGPQMEYKPTIYYFLKHSENISDLKSNLIKSQKNTIFEIDERISNALINSKVNYVSKLKQYCDNGICEIMIDSKILIVKKSHWTVFGSQYLTNKLLKKHVK